MRSQKTTSLLAVLAVAFTACGGGEAGMEMEAEEGAAPAAAEADPTIAPEGEATGLPAGFMLTLDREGENPADFHVMEMGGGHHIQTGPAGVFYNPSQSVASGDYTVSATFTEMQGPANHREAYGLIIGGSGLDGADQQYAYFIVRGDGSWLIKERAGAEATNVSDGWAQAEGINTTTGEGETTNTLEVAVRGDQVHFSVNGTEVGTVPAAEIPTHGIVGVRVNHNLNVMVSDFNVQQGM